MQVEERTVGSLVLLVALHGLVSGSTADDLVGELGLVGLGGEVAVGLGLVALVWTVLDTREWQEMDQFTYRGTNPW